MSETVKQILECAVLQACEHELKRLKEHANEDIGLEIVKGLKEISKLSNFADKPDYTNPWTAFHHAIWYHLSHVNFLKKELGKLLQDGGHLDSREILRIVDFGCGTMPVKWGIALALADARSLAKVVISNYDTSKQMKDFGVYMWNRLVDVVDSRKSQSEVGLLRDAIGRIKATDFEINPFPQIPKKAKKRQRERIRRKRREVREFLSNAHLLVATHCIYDESDCEKILRLSGCWNMETFLTLNSERAREISRLQQSGEVEVEWSGNLTKLTEFRKEKLYPLCEKFKEGCNCLRWLRGKPVPWEPKDATVVKFKQ